VNLATEKPLASKGYVVAAIRHMILHHRSNSVRANPDAPTPSTSPSLRTPLQGTLAGNKLVILRTGSVGFSWAATARYCGGCGASTPPLEAR